MDPKICYVVNSVSETSVPATIATALVDYEDLQVDILAWFSTNRFEGEDKLTIYNLNAPGTTFGINRETYRTARKILESYDIIQAHHPHSGSFAKVIAHCLGIPSVSREGNTRNGFTRKGRIANGLTNAFADRIVPNSQAVYDSFKRWERLLIDDDRVEIIRNGVDLEWIDRACGNNYNIRRQFDIPSESLIVGTVSVISEQKALDILVRGLKNANTISDHRLDLIIAGDGPERPAIEKLVDRLGVGRYVHFTGMVDRDTVYRILGDIDIYAMASRWEGFSNAAVEALGAGNPCLFSDIDPFLNPYRNVAMFHRLNDADDLANKLVELAEDSDLREFYGYKGRELVEQNYTLEQVAERYAQLYTELV